MKPEEMRELSQKKFNQIADLMKLLQVSIQPKQKVTADGFIEQVVVFTDNEPYPAAPVVERGPETEDKPTENV